VLKELDYKPKMPEGKPPMIAEKKSQQEVDLIAKTAAEKYKYLLIKCFTGWGSKSVIMVNRFQEAKPEISYCEGLYPNGTDYAVDKLWTEVTGSA
jgi:hypothetical protein